MSSPIENRGIKSELLQPRMGLNRPFFIFNPIRGDFVATILQNADYLDASREFMKGYPKRLSAISQFDAQRAAQKTIRKDQLFWVVVGAPEIAPILEKYGKVYSYNLDLEPLADKSEKVTMSVSDLMKRHAQALGGMENLNKIQSISVKAKIVIDAQGQHFDATSTRKIKAPNKKYLSLQMPFGNQQFWINGKSAWMAGMQGSAAEEMDAAKAKTAIAEATMFYTCKLPDLGYKCEITGKQNGQIILKATGLGDADKEFYFVENHNRSYMPF